MSGNSNGNKKSNVFLNTIIQKSNPKSNEIESHSNLTQSYREEEENYEENNINSNSVHFESENNANE